MLNKLNKGVDYFKQKMLLDKIFDLVSLNDTKLLFDFFENSVIEEKIKTSRVERTCLKCGKQIIKKQKYFSRIFNDLGNFSYCLSCIEKKELKNKFNKKINSLVG